MVGDGVVSLRQRDWREPVREYKIRPWGFPAYSKSHTGCRFFLSSASAVLNAVQLCLKFELQTMKAKDID